MVDSIAQSGFFNFNLIILGYFAIIVFIFGPLLTRNVWVGLILSAYVALAVANSAPKIAFVDDLLNKFAPSFAIFGIILIYWLFIFAVVFSLAQNIIVKQIAINNDSTQIFIKLIFALSFAGIVISSFFRFLGPNLKTFVEGLMGGTLKFLVMNDIAYFLWLISPFVLMYFLTPKKV